MNLDRQSEPAQQVALDPLEALLARTGPSANVFFAGKLCESTSFSDAPAGAPHARYGHLHLLRIGSLEVINAQAQCLKVTEPSVLFYARASQHRFVPDPEVGAELLCASLSLGAALNATIVPAMPLPLVIALREIETLSATLELLFSEAFAQRSGRQLALNRLAEYLLVLLLRHVIESKRIQTGTLAAFADPKLAQVVQLMHRQPEKPWTIDSLAAIAGMSRARLAAQFREKTGETVLGYLTGWRIALAKHLLLRGKPLKSVAYSVGYRSPNALSKPFFKSTGKTISIWLKEQHSSKVERNQMMDNLD